MPKCSGDFTSSRYTIQRFTINDAQFMHKLCKHAYFIQRQFMYQGKKKYNRDIQRPGFPGAENS